MRIRLIAAGTRMPGWVKEGYAEYARRLTGEVTLELREVALDKRGETARRVRAEGERLLAGIPQGALCVALEVTGRAWDTPALVKRLQAWLFEGREVALLVGGPDGLSPACSQRADLSWSLSPLTLPHPLVRVLLAEQLYRAWTILKHHPYHR